MCKVHFKVKKYVAYGNECHHFFTYSKCQLLTYHFNLLTIYSWFTAILGGTFTQVLLRFIKKNSVWLSLSRVFFVIKIKSLCSVFEIKLS